MFIAHHDVIRRHKAPIEPQISSVATVLLRQLAVTQKYQEKGVNFNDSVRKSGKDPWFT